MQTVVNHSESLILKDMIFKRIAERNNAISNDIKDDIMNDARESFSSSRNPFGNITQEFSLDLDNDIVTNTTPVETQNTDIVTNNDGIGFKQKTQKISDLKIQKLKNNNTQIYNSVSSAAITNNMMEASESLRSSVNFVGALNFLNNKAAEELLKNKGAKFDIVA